MRGADFNKTLVVKVERVGDVIAGETAGWARERAAEYGLSPDALVATQRWTTRHGEFLTGFAPAPLGARLGDVLERRTK